MSEAEEKGWMPIKPNTQLALTVNGQRHFYAAHIPAGKDPMEMTLGEWMAAPAWSGNALLNDFLARRPPLDTEKTG